MRHFSLPLAALLTLFCLTVGFGDSVVKEFRAEPGLNKVYLVWKVSLESDVAGYQVRRGFTATQLQDLEFIQSNSETIPPGGTKKYEFVDQSVFKTSNRSYYYQIVVTNPQGEVVTSTEIKEVSPQISAVRHTWGSIKAMFR